MTIRQASAEQKDPVILALRSLLVNHQEDVPGRPGLAASAVLLPLFRKDGEYHILLNKRTDLVEHHKGEICFPGGMRDPEDRDHLHTALREAQEELGIVPRDVEILGELDAAATRTGFLIRPVVGLIPYPYPFVMSPTEVAAILEVPFSTLLDPAALREERSARRGAYNPHYSYVHQGHVVYGATATILTQFVRRLAQASKKEVPWSSLHPASAK